MEVKCPRCGEPAQYSPENPWRPFCSERCKLIDLGNWAEGKYAIPTNESESDSDMSEAGGAEDADPADENTH
jgi:uncharacterized protein